MCSAASSMKKSFITSGPGILRNRDRHVAVTSLVQLLAILKRSLLMMVIQKSRFTNTVVIWLAVKLNSDINYKLRTMC